MAGRSRRAGSKRAPRVVSGMPSVQLSRAEFERRFRERFHDPSFDAVAAQIDDVVAVAWKNYVEYHKSPRTKRAGRGFADPEFELPAEWLAARAAIRAAAKTHASSRSRSRILLVNASSRSNQTCPGEMSKTYRLAEIARRVLEKKPRTAVDFLDLSRLASEYGRAIHPCKACVSTAMPLCHWPCSCYPNHALGQVGDWMNELYPRFVAAHGVMLVTPVNWYHATSPLKLLIDRLVCADGGNPDPTTTGGKDPKLAKALELEGWAYPKHLAGRAFAVVVHGDAAGVDGVRRSLCDWLEDLGLVSAGPAAELGRYIGYYEPYATSHDDFERDESLHVEVRNAAEALFEKVRQLRRDPAAARDPRWRSPRQK